MISFFSTTSSVFASRIDSCNPYESFTEDYQYGSWIFTINGLSTGMSGGFKSCEVETQFRTYAFWRCIKSKGYIDDEKVLDLNENYNEIDLETACYKWAKNLTLKAQFSCDEHESSCRSGEPIEIIFKP